MAPYLACPMVSLLRSLGCAGGHFQSARSAASWKRGRRAIGTATDAFLQNEKTIEALAASVSPRASDLVKNMFALQREDISDPPVSSLSLSTPISTKNVFANRELDMSKISAIGFDYDYTLAAYKTSLQHFIYDEAKYHLLVEAGYPEQLASLKFEKDFAVRGLTFDRRTGML